MSAVFLVIHLILALAIIGLVLLQRSEGGGLGMGSSGGMGSFATPQATANALTRATWICAGLFFVTSLLLGVMAGHSTSKKSIIDQLDSPAAMTAPAEAGKVDAKDDKKTTAKSEPSVPISE